jgi:hypothetical protein
MVGLPLLVFKLAASLPAASRLPSVIFRELMEAGGYIMSPNDGGN